ncbi:MAG: sulfotransferase domain-containing protein [Chitinophagales bacterium]|nr:sulfotransferase domain-containing protein [Chitinophagales bacterium]MDW8427891.1 sulfotransferase domain-containing protein [Chitinophagales bacterium]
MSTALPNLIIAGVHKAGTTSVFTYLALHPQVCGSTIKEIGYFMPLRYGGPLPKWETYLSHWHHCRNEVKYRLEASPSYLYGGEAIAEAIARMLGPEVRILILLREPVERLFSFYERKKVNAFLPSHLNFRQFAEQSLQRAELLPDLGGDDVESLLRRGFREGCYVDFLPAWLDRFGPRLRLMFFEHLRQDTAAFMRDLCQWLDLDFSAYRPQDFAVENQTTGVRFAWLHRSLLTVNKKFEVFWRRNVGLKRTLRSLYKRINAVESRRERLADDDRQWLETAYLPYNRRLAVLLKQQGITTWPEWLAKAAYASQPA